MRRWLALAMSLVVTAGCGAPKPADPADPQGYAVRLGVTPAPGAPLQRLGVPAEAIAALRAPDRSDLRLFDASGVALPLAAVAPAGDQARLGEVSLEAFPILGSTGALRADGAVLSIEDRDRGRVVRVTRTSPGDEGTAMLGALFDTRAIRDKVRSIRLDASFPAQQPVNFAIETSADLSDWTPLGGRILYRRAADRADALGPETIPLGEADLRGRYLRVTWTSPSRLLAPVIVRAATFATARAVDGERPAIATSPPALLEAHEVRITLDHAIAPAAMRIVPQAGEMLVPVRVLGRNAPDQGWTALGAGTLRQGGAAAIALAGGTWSQYRIEADRRTPGFAKPPAIELVFAPLQLVTLFSGKPPYTLSAGMAAADNRYLAIGELIPGWRPGAEDRLPQAAVATTPGAMLALAADPSGVLDRRKALLWGLLLAGVVALGWMVWRLWRPPSGKPPA